MSSDEVPSEPQDAASDFAELLRENRNDLEKLIRRNQWGRETLDDIQSDLSQHGIAASDIVNLAAQELQEVVTRAILDRPDLAFAHEAVRRAHLVIVNTDAVGASSQRYAHGDGLIRISDGLYSLTGHLAETGQLVLMARKTVSERSALLAASAALRFNIHQRRVWDLPGKIGASDHRLALQESERGTAALFFILAHEIGHLALGHPPASVARALPAREVHQLELDADSFAARVLEGMEHRGDLAHGAAAQGCRLGLMAADFHERSGFIRPPRTHPSRSVRVDNLAWLLDGRAEPLSRAAEMAIELALDLSSGLPGEAWASLFSSSLWNTSILEHAQYQGVIQIDSLYSSSKSDLMGVLERLELDGAAKLVRTMKAHTQGMALVDVLNDLGVENASEFLDDQTPLAYHQLVEPISSSHLWQSATERYKTGTFLRLVAATTCVLLLEDKIREGTPT